MRYNIYDKSNNLVAGNVHRSDFDRVEGLEDCTILSGNLETGFQFSNHWYSKICGELPSGNIKPNHYIKNGTDLIAQTAQTVEPDEFREIMKFNIKKYVTRYDQKNGLEDLTKAEEYIRRLKEWEVNNGESMKCQRRKD